MKQENICFIYSMINNVVIAILKITGGFIFKLNSLFADGLHTFSDFVTDIIAFFGMKLSKRKATKIHPFGFGRVEYITNLFIGIILFCLGIFIFIHSFSSEGRVVSLNVIWLLMVAAILKGIAIVYMYSVGKKNHSQTLLMGVQESLVDLYSSLGVVVITLLLQLRNKIPVLQYSDMIGSILFSLIIFKTAYDIIKNNIFSLLGEIETNKKLIDEIEEYVLSYDNIEKCHIELIKYGKYFALNLDLDLDSKMTLKRATKLQNRLMKNIKRKKDFSIKYVDIHISSNS